MKALEYIKDIFQWRNGWNSEDHDRVVNDFINTVFQQVLVIPAGTPMSMVEMDNPGDLNSPIIHRNVRTATTNSNAQITNIRFIDDSALIFSVIHKFQTDNEYREVETFYQVHLHILLDRDNCYFETNDFNALTLSFSEIASL
jgi:hypothetical protein